MDNTKGITGNYDVTPSVRKGKNYLLAIGINEYVHCRKLNNAVKDVRDFIALMTSKYLFEDDYITTLFDDEATSRKIVHTFRSLAQKITPDDNFIVYFSGHGEFDKVLQQGYWIPVNAERGEIDDYLPNSTVRDVLNAINSHHTFLIADSCFSGSLFSSRDANRDISQRLETEPSRWGLTSGRNEVVSDGLPDTNSPFAEKLLSLLRKSDKPMGAAELCARMMEIVAANAQQTPRGEPLKIKGHEGGQFFFHPKNNEAEDWANVDKTSVTALKNFEKKHPLSKYGAEIAVFMQKIAEKEAETQRIAEVKRKADAEKQAYNRAIAHPTAYNLNLFLKNYPLSTYAESIEKRLAEAEEEAAWKEAKNQNSITAYRGFMRRYPQSGLAVEAQKRIETKEAELEAEKMRRQNAEKEAIERKQQAEKEAADKLKAAEAKAEQERQKKIWETEAAQLKADRDKAERERTEKERLAQQERERIEKAEKERIEKLNREKVERERVEKERLEKEKQAAKPTVEIGSSGNEPSSKRNWYIGGGVMAIIIASVFMMNRPTTSNDTPSVKTEVVQDQTPYRAVAAAKQLEPDMVNVKGGTFKMGSNESDSEKPVHDVTLKDFKIGKYEITQWQWREVMGSDPSELRFKGCDDCPVENVSWDDIQEFLKKLNAKTGKKYRLPTEAEWEYAARGGANTQGFSYSGGGDLKSVAWYDDNSGNKTHPIGQKQANELGIYDMSGNVWEWCNDWYDTYSSAAISNPKGAATGSYRVYRGGSWLHGAYGCRPTYRYLDPPTDRNGYLGFRVCSSLQ